MNSTENFPKTSHLPIVQFSYWLMNFDKYRRKGKITRKGINTNVYFVNKILHFFLIWDFAREKATNFIHRWLKFSSTLKFLRLNITHISPSDRVLKIYLFYVESIYVNAHEAAKILKAKKKRNVEIKRVHFYGNISSPDKLETSFSSSIFSSCASLIKWIMKLRKIKIKSYK